MLEKSRWLRSNGVETLQKGEEWECTCEHVSGMVYLAWAAITTVFVMVSITIARAWLIGYMIYARENGSVRLGAVSPEFLLLPVPLRIRIISVRLWIPRDGITYVFFTPFPNGRLVPLDSVSLFAARLEGKRLVHGNQPAV